MISSLSTKDNNCGIPFSEIKTESGEKPEAHDYENLIKIANTSIKDLVNNTSSLLVFPEVLGNYEDGIEEQHVFDISGAPDNLSNVKLTTGNIMGFIGVGSTQLKISSRFSDDENDFFMQYMLQKVFSINLFDYKYSKGSNGMLDLLMFSFPFLLKKALAQGLYKQYKTFHRNDSNVKGVININTHIKENNPFRGNVAYSSRERTFDNNLTQLIRHTIEYIKTSHFGKQILSVDYETTKCTKQIVEATPSYNIRERGRIISNNLIPINHPYFTNYKPLQKLCLSILRHEKIGYEDSKERIYGVLFDGAWLWEEYLASVLYKCGFKHPKNKSHTDGINVYKGNLRYPDFYLGNQTKIEDYSYNISGNFVLDAKYKHLENHKIDKDEISGFFSRDDLHQLITYMYILPAKSAGLIYPYDKNDEMNKAGKIIVSPDRALYGYGGSIRTYGIPIPIKRTFSDFVLFMNNIEDELKIYKWK